MLVRFLKIVPKISLNEITSNKEVEKIEIPRYLNKGFNHPDLIKIFIYVKVDNSVKSLIFNLYQSKKGGFCAGCVTANKLGWISWSAFKKIMLYKLPKTEIVNLLNNWDSKTYLK